MPAEKMPAVRGVDFIANPALAQQLVGLLYALRNINVQLTVGQASQTLAPGSSQIVGTAPNLILPIPIKLATPIANPSGDSSAVSAYSSTTGTTASYAATTFGATYTSAEQTKLNTLSSSTATLVTDYNALVTKFNTLSTATAALVTAYNTTAATSANLQTQVTSLLAALRIAGLLPS